jgi:glycolate oxidase FAD binding subunit
MNTARERLRPPPPPPGSEPPGLIRPRDEAELGWAVEDAASAGHRLRIEGGGTRSGLGRPVETESVLCTSGLSGIVLYEPAALTLVAGAGARLSMVEAMLAAEGQRLPFEPMDHRALYGTGGEPTLGGMVAVNASGPRRIQAGACRDSLIGVRFVDGRGTVVKNGGRVMKNVTGYDLVKLIAGSHGTLGVITEVSFKLLPIPETAATLVIEGLDDAAAVAALSAALGSPYDVTGAAHVDGRTMVRIEGFAPSVAYRAERLAAHLRPHGPVTILRDAAESGTMWAAVRDGAAVADGSGAVWRVSLRPSDAAATVKALRDSGPVEAAAYDWGGGLVWLRVPERTEARWDARAAEIRALASRVGGHATLLRAGEAMRRAVAPFHPEPAPVAALSAGLRAKFDPHGILNPGRMA